MNANMSRDCIEQLDLALERKAAGAVPWTYFDRRVKSPEETRRVLPYAPVSPESDRRGISFFLNEKTALFPRVIYVHVPFCDKICRFCGYNRVETDDADRVSGYVKALKSQIARWAKTPWARAAPFEAVYFGGGTPTALAEPDLVDLLSEIGSSLPLADSCEITVESRIGDIRRGLVERLLGAGVNRMSFGVQTFDTRTRRFSGRIENRESVVKKLRLAFESGLDNLCADLICNLEKQGVTDFERDLATLDSLPLSACDIYPLILFERSALKRAVARGEAESPAGVEMEYRYFTTMEKNMKNGWRRHSPVHFGKPGRERALYVTARSRGCDVLAFGAGAAGCIGSMAYINRADIAGYIESWKNGGDSGVAAFGLPEAFLKFRRVYGLSEGEGAFVADLSELFSDHGAALNKMSETGLVEISGDKCRLTETGRFWAGNISLILSLAIAKRLDAR